LNAAFEPCRFPRAQAHQKPYMDLLKHITLEK